MSGMRAMSDAMEPLQHNATFLHAMSVVSNPLLCILIGIVVTAVVQSCSASIGILQALAVTGGTDLKGKGLAFSNAFTSGKLGL